MLLEEFYNEGKKTENVQLHFYIATLSAYLIYNDLEIFDKLLQEFEDKEEYLICSGIQSAIEKIEEVHSERFNEASIEIGIEEDEEGLLTFSYEKHKEISKLIFKDILTEIYEKQIGQSTSDS
jgi:predicted transcriptional regulator